MRITPDRVIPALQWGRQYDRGKLVSDLLAAVIATVMLIPQSLAYAMLAGLPPEVGLYARPNGVAAGAASRAVEQAIQPVIIELNSKPAADKARTSAKDNGVGDDDAPFMSHGSDIKPRGGAPFLPM
ncbi:MAG: SulP family inorganic anion transporter [Rhodoplanes sp.]